MSQMSKSLSFRRLLYKVCPYPSSDQNIMTALTHLPAELHDYMDAGTGRQFGMPVRAFVDEAFEGLTAGSDQIIIGSIGPADAFHEIVDKRRAAFENLAKMIRKE